MLKIDLHNHSINSGHAYGTIYEIIAEAQRKQMTMIAITDHGPSLPGTLGPFHFGMGPRAPKEIDGLKLLWGAEANIIDENGSLDIPLEYQPRLDIIIGNFHNPSGYQDRGKKRNTQAIIKAFKNPRFKILTHPLHGQHEYDEDEVLHTAIDNGVLLELNLSYIRKELPSLEKAKRLIKLVRSRNAKLIVNSDSHFLHEIGNDTVLKDNWDNLEITEDLIINNYPTELKQALKVTP